MSVVPITGQPGLFRNEASAELSDYLDGGRRRWHPLRGALRGLGDARQDAIVSKLTDVTAQYNTSHTNATKLLAAFGPLDEPALLNLGAAIKALKARDAAAIARMTGAQFAGVVRMGFAAAKGNIVRAETIVHGNLGGHETIAEHLLVAAKNVLDAVGVIVDNATAAVGTATGYAQSVGLGLVQTQNVRPLYGLQRVQTQTVSPLYGYKGLRQVHVQTVSPLYGLGELGVVLADDAVMAIIIAAGVLIGVALLLGVYVYVHQSQAASDEADRACAAGAAAGQPCTSADWSAAHAAAAAAERSLSPLPNFNDLFQQAGSLLFWGGMAAVVAAIAYAGWTAAPAAAITRERLRARASRL